MAIRILNELNSELTRVCVAGSSLAYGDPRIKKYIPMLSRMGEKAPVFKALAMKIERLVNVNEDSSKSLIEALTILYSVLHTQGSIDTDDYTSKVGFSNMTSKINKLPHSKIKVLQEQMRDRPKGKEDAFVSLYENNLHDDIRLYSFYCDSISDHKTPVSNYLEETLIPSIGESIVPFIEERLDIEGTKKDARLFKILYKIIGRDILPLSLKVLEEGAKDVVAQAIYTLSEDEKFEKNLLSYATSKNPDIKGAAFFSLMKIGSKEGEELLVDYIKKENIVPLCESLRITTIPNIVEIIISELELEIGKQKIRRTKVRNLLEILADRDEKKAIEYIESLFLDEKKYSKLKENIEIANIIEILRKQNIREKNTVLYRIYNQNKDFIRYAIWIDIKNMSGEDVYEKYHKIVLGEKDKKNIYGNNLGNNIIYGYDIQNNINIPDEEKKWDRRWAGVFIEIESIWNRHHIIYDDDKESWIKLLEKGVKKIASQNKVNRYYYDEGRILAKLFKIDRPLAEKYYKLFIEKGYKEKLLIKDLEQYGVIIEQ